MTKWKCLTIGCTRDALPGGWCFTHADIELLPYQRGVIDKMTSEKSLVVVVPRKPK